jgi:hypothetical protein
VIMNIFCCVFAVSFAATIGLMLFMYFANKSHELKR